jgi:hypothetical protein
MLPEVEAMFTLVRRLAQRETVTDVAAPKWLVQRHGLASLAARSGGTEHRAELVRATLDWAELAAALPPIVAALREANVRVCILKGFSFAVRLYATPAERPMADVDLMVPHGQVAAARQVLTSLGFQPAAEIALHHAAAYSRGNLMIDLHWDIIGPGRARIDLDAVWSRTQPSWLSGAVELEPIDALVFHMVHFARNRLLLPLINVVDASRLFEVADAEAARERAASWGLRTPVSLALAFCQNILAGRSGHFAGWLGPSRDEVAFLAELSTSRKLLFDVRAAGSSRQLVARLIQLGANRLRPVSRARR